MDVERTLADGEPHTFAELYQVVEAKIRPDVAVIQYNRENPGAAHVALHAKVTIGKRRVLQHLLANFKRQGLLTQEGRGLTSVYRRVPDEAARLAVLEEASQRRIRRAQAGLPPQGRPFKPGKGEVPNNE